MSGKIYFENGKWRVVDETGKVHAALDECHYDWAVEIARSRGIVVKPA